MLEFSQHSAIAPKIGYGEVELSWTFPTGTIGIDKIAYPGIIQFGYGSIVKGWISKLIRAEVRVKAGGVADIKPQFDLLLLNTWDDTALSLNTNFTYPTGIDVKNIIGNIEYRTPDYKEVHSGGVLADAYAIKEPNLIITTEPDTTSIYGVMIGRLAPLTDKFTANHRVYIKLYYEYYDGNPKLYSN